LGDRRSVTPLLEVIPDSDPDFVVTVVLALGRLGGHRAIAMLENVVEEDMLYVTRVRKVAAQVLHELTLDPPEYDEDDLEELPPGPPPVRSEMIE